MFPTPAQLLTKLLEMIHQGNEPGPGINPTKIWDDEITILAVRRPNEYLIRLECDGRQSQPVLHWDKVRWSFASKETTLDIIDRWLSLFRDRFQNDVERIL